MRKLITHMMPTAFAAGTITWIISRKRLRSNTDFTDSKTIQQLVQEMVEATCVLSGFFCFQILAKFSFSVTKRQNFHWRKKGWTKQRSALCL